MHTTVKKIIAAVLSITLIAGVCFVLSRQEIKDFHDKYADTDLTVDVQGMERNGTYTKYLDQFASADKPKEDIEIDLDDYTSTGTVKKEADGLFTDTGSEVTFKVNVPQEGLYRLYLEYMIYIL